MKVNLNWITPEADKKVAYMARVSNANAKPDDPSEKLIKYLIDHKHWSPFEMACMCVEIETTRDIARQILRHRSFHFQELSQRYAVAAEEAEFAEARLQDHKNRQNSLRTDSREIQWRWDALQKEAWETDYLRYQEALDLGIAKELARKLLPEGLTKTRMYMQGTLRDWMHYLDTRMGPETQKEHRDVAYAIWRILYHECPIIHRAASDASVIEAWSHVE